MFKDLLSLNKALQPEEPRPYYTSVVVIDKERELIMLARRKGDGLWTSPGGAANLGENPKQAVIREAFEEANLILKPRELKELPTNLCLNGKVCHCFLVYVDSKKVNAHSSNDPDKEVSKWEWFSLNDKLPKLDFNRLNTVNAAKMKLYGLRKSIVDQREAGIALNTAEQSQDAIATSSSAWVGIIESTMKYSEYGESPKELSLPDYKTLLISKLEDGVYSALVRNDDPNTGNYGEIMSQLFKMTPEAMVAALQAKGYVPKAAQLEVAPAPMPVNDFSSLYEALKDFEGNLHIHLAKSLDALVPPPPDYSDLNTALSKVL